MGKKWQSEAQRRILARQCRDSFWHFFLHAYGALYNPEGTFLFTPLHKQFCEWLQEQAEPWLRARGTPEAYRLYLAILMPRRTGKSVIATRAFPLWLWLRDPDLSFTVGAMRTSLAHELVAPTLTILRGKDPYARFEWLFGNWFNSDRTWSQLLGWTHAARINLSKPDTSLNVFGVETGLTGKHPDVGIIDDPTDYEKMKSDGNWLTSVNEAVESLAYVLESDGMLMMPGTRYADGDHFGTFLHSQGVRSVTGMPTDQFKLDPEGRWNVFYWDIWSNPTDRFLTDGTSTVPTVWADRDIKAEFRINARKAAAQLRNDPTMSPSNPLNDEELEGCWIQQDDLPSFHNLEISFHLDTALIDQYSTGNSGMRKNRSVIAVAGHWMDGSGRVVFLGARGDHNWHAEQFLDALVTEVVQWRRKGARIRGITDDRALGGHKGGWRMAMESRFRERAVLMPYLHELVRHGRVAKERRIQSSLPFWRSGKVKLLVGAPMVDELVYQMQRIGLAEDDDVSDAFADVFVPAIYTKPLGPSPETSEEHEEQPMDRYLKGNGIAADADALINRIFDR